MKIPPTQYHYRRAGHLHAIDRNHLPLQTSPGYCVEVRVRVAKKVDTRQKYGNGFGESLTRRIQHACCASKNILSTVKSFDRQPGYSAENVPTQKRYQ